jgi:hypothetical protein
MKYHNKKKVPKNFPTRNLKKTKNKPIVGKSSDRIRIYARNELKIYLVRALTQSNFPSNPYISGWFHLRYLYHIYVRQTDFRSFVIVILIR